MHTFDLIAGLASLVGLLFSLGALIQASRASRAAVEARDAILMRSVVDDFELACLRMDQLMDFVSHDRLAEAALRAGELSSTLSEIPFRRSPYLAEAQRNRLLNVRQQVQIVTEMISGARQPSRTDKVRVVRICGEGLMTLREILGTIKGDVDMGGQQ